LRAPPGLETEMSMLKKASNKMAYGKIGIYGEAGAGKSRTAAEIAIGLVKTYKLDKPIGIFDTEPAWSFILPLIAKAGLPEPFVYDESRAFKDLMTWTLEAKAACSVLIVDSISHIWRDLQESFLAKVNAGRKKNGKKPIAGLEFQHWGPIKRQWSEFTDLYLSSPVHFIVCGRAGNVYEYQEKDDGSGKKELITVGTKMATEKEMGYEPSLLIEMFKDIDDGKIINTAIIQKDRADKLNGKTIPFPNFKSFKGHFESLNIGGEHFGSMRDRDSQDVFTETGEDTFAADMRRRDVALDEIKEELLRHHGHGQDAGTKAAKAATLEKVAGTRSWERLASMNVADVQAARSALWKLTRGHEYGAAPAPVTPTTEETFQGDEDIPHSPQEQAAA
jgi:hypothetical protein